MNPKIKDFLKDNPDVTVLGLYWAGLWRFTIVYCIACIAIFALATLFGR